MILFWCSVKFLIVYYDVGYYNINFIRFIIMYVWLAANYCYPVDEDYRIGIVEVGNNKLCESNNNIKIGFIKPMLIT